MSDFKKRFTTLPDRKLMAIVSQSADYEPEAVSAAQEELERRAIGEDELAAYRKTASVEANARNQRSAGYRRAVEQGRGMLRETVATVHPVQQQPLPLRRKILLIELILLYFLVMEVVGLVDYLPYFLPIEDLGYALNLSVYIIPCLLLPPAMWLLWRRQTLGWTLSGFYAGYQLVSSVLMLIYSASFYAEIDYGLVYSGRDSNGLVGLLNLFAPEHPLRFLPNILCHGAILWMLSRQDILTTYRPAPLDWGMLIGGIICLSFLNYLVGY